MWNAFACSHALTVAVVQTKACQGPSLCVWWTQDKQKPPQRVQVQNHQIAPVKGPTPRTAVVTQIPKTKDVKMVTVRLLTPQFYRCFIPGITGPDNPKSVIAAWVSMSGCQASQLTGGQWHVAQHPHGDILLRHIKTTQALADKLIPLSGQQALFATEGPKKGWMALLRQAAS